ncbi:MAG: thioredoxin family protein [Sulfurovum sp.]|nr:thioredoxin family protein [Sulfurovum sp.]
MKIIIPSFIFLSLVFLPAYGEETSKSVKVGSSQSPKHKTIQNLQKNEETLEAYDKLIWETDMDDAFERAKKEHRNVMVMVEDTRCKWCKNMKVGALSDPNVQDILQSYILLKVQRSDKKTADRIKDFTGAIPSFYFMQPDQEVFESVVGYFMTEDFLGFLNEIEEED